MDPVLKSTITTVATYLVGAVGAWAVAHNYLTPDQASSLGPDVIGAGSIIIGGALVWWKARQHTPAAQIAAVNNANNGVKVVPATAPAPAVTAPLK